MTGEDVDLLIEVIPSVVGVAEAAEIMGWDKRRVITYIDRGSFPEPITTLASGRIWIREDVEEYADLWRATHPPAPRNVRRRCPRRRDRPRPVPDPSRPVRLRLVRSTMGERPRRPMGPTAVRGGRRAGDAPRQAAAVMELEPFVVYSSPLPPRARDRRGLRPTGGGGDRVRRRPRRGEHRRMGRQAVRGDHRDRPRRRAPHPEPAGDLAPSARSRAERPVPRPRARRGRLDPRRAPRRERAGLRSRRRDQRLRRRAARAGKRCSSCPTTPSLNSVDVAGETRNVRFLNDVLHLTDPLFFE